MPTSTLPGISWESPPRPAKAAGRVTRPPGRLPPTRQETANLASLVRGALIAACDEQLLRGPLGAALCQTDRPSPAARQLLAELRDAPTEAVGWRVLRAYLLTEVYQALMVGLFPEEFGEPGVGVCPAAGPRRVGGERLREFVRLMGLG